MIGGGDGRNGRFGIAGGGTGGTLLAMALFVAAASPGVARAEQAPESTAGSAEAAGTASAPAPAIRPPRLVEGAEATYPEEALAAGAEGTVVLRLTIDAAGTVTEVEVLEDPGHGLAQAAIDAATRFVFEPARRGETPFASRVLHRVEFRLPAPEPEPLPAEPPTAAEAPAGEEVLEVVVEDVSPAQQLRRSARAVQVIETGQAKREAANLGEVLARHEGISVRRSGGLGGRSEFALNGLSGERVRFFLDGIPLNLAGYPFGVSSIPVNLVDRVEVYRGVVPVAFGADALGGAVHLVSEPIGYGTGANASYQFGSFGTHRVTAGGRHLDDASGFYARVDGFFDSADNDYEVDVQAWEPDTGRTYDARVPLRNNGYRAWGIGVETGFADRSFADRLALRLFHTARDRELNHDQRMARPFYEVTNERKASGGNLSWKVRFGETEIDSVVGYAYSRLGLRSLEPCVADWFGGCRPREGGTGSELSDSLAYDQRIDQHAAFARLRLGWQLHPDHDLRVALAPTYTTRYGRNRAISAERDTGRGDREILALVSGVEWESRLFRDDLTNIVFVKHYVQAIAAEELQGSGIMREVDRTTTRFGVGDSLRWRIAQPLYAKASWELATRLPNADELFGNGDLIAQNLDLEPEVSHNFNLGLTLERIPTAVGGLRFDVNGFARITDDLIIQVAKEAFVQHQNVASATSVGVEAGAGLLLPGDWLELSGNITWQDFRNTSSEPPFSQSKGDRIANTPWLFGNFAARSRFDGVLADGDELSLAWITRWTHEFLTGWEGISETGRIAVPTQLVHTAHVGYARRLDGHLTTLGVEMENVTDRTNYDFYGVQRPGRALYAKLTLEL